MQDYPGRLHFATDAWTSPNHRAFVAWTVHLEHEGKMFSFLLDIIEVAEVSEFVKDSQLSVQFTIPFVVAYWPNNGKSIPIYAGKIWVDPQSMYFDLNVLLRK